MQHKEIEYEDLSGSPDRTKQVFKEWEWNLKFAVCNIIRYSKKMVLYFLIQVPGTENTIESTVCLLKNRHLFEEEAHLPGCFQGCNKILC